MAKLLINKERVEKRANALIQVYCNHRKTLPDLGTFVNDYYSITDSNKGNRTLNKQTIDILQTLHRAKLNEKKMKLVLQIPIEK